MYMSKLFGQTLREKPSEADVTSYQLLLRAGFIRQLGAGIFSYLPLAQRSMMKIMNIMREEINAIGGQEITMPVVHPADIWKETNRWYQIDDSLTRFTDRAGRDMALAMTHEEVIGDLVRNDIRSYRQLPALLYQIQTKWRDEPRPRAGLIRTREFTMKDSYSLDSTWEGLDAQYRAHYQAYFNIFRRCGLPVIAVKSDVGMMGGSMAHEFMFLTPSGEDTLFLCRSCGYSANREVVNFRKPAAAPEDPLPIEKVATPNTTTIEDLANFLNIPKAKTAKAVFMVATMIEGKGEATQHREKFVFAVVRGDMEVNETKLGNAIKAKAMRPAKEAEILAIGAVPGYASPIGISDAALVVIDDAVAHSPNLVMGANEVGYHLQHVNFPRDYTAHLITDIAAPAEGDGCPVCGQPLQIVRGVEVGNIFKLGTRYSDALKAYFLDKDGKSKPVIMGSYGIGVGRLLSCIAEMHNDENGLIWPITVAPFEVHLVSLAGAEEQAEQLYRSLLKAGIEVLYDERDEHAGTKFKDADLIGIPLRITISAKTLKQGAVEFKRRSDASRENTLIPLENVIPTLQAEIAALQAAIAQTVVPEPFRD